LREFPIIPCNLCGSQENLARQRTKQLLKNLAQENEKIPSNILHALQALQPSQLMDKRYWDFKGLESLRQNGELANINEPVNIEPLMMTDGDEPLPQQQHNDGAVIQFQQSARSQHNQ